MYTDVEAADTMITRLGDFLRLTLESDGRTEVPLAEELEFALRYLEIERTRFEDRLEVRVAVPDACRAALVPTLLLQPLVENAIRHGIDRQPEGGRLEIAALREAGRLWLRVANDGPAPGGTMRKTRAPSAWQHAGAPGVALRRRSRAAPRARPGWRGRGDGGAPVAHGEADPRRHRRRRAAGPQEGPPAAPAPRRRGGRGGVRRRPAGVAALRAGADVLFLDVRMPGLDGLGLLRVLPAQRTPAVVFVTAHAGYAVKAFDAEAVDYLLKPFDRRRFDRALERARRRLQGSPEALRRSLERALARVEAAQPRLATGQASERRLAFRLGRHTVMLAVDEVRWIGAEGKYVRVPHATRSTSCERPCAIWRGGSRSGTSCVSTAACW